jgi:hypothetical protein
LNCCNIDNRTLGLHGRCGACWVSAVYHTALPGQTGKKERSACLTHLIGKQDKSNVYTRRDPVRGFLLWVARKFLPDVEIHTWLQTCATHESLVERVIVATKNIWREKKYYNSHNDLQLATDVNAMFKAVSDGYN